MSASGGKAGNIMGIESKTIRWIEQLKQILGKNSKDEDDVQVMMRHLSGLKFFTNIFRRFGTLKIQRMFCESMEIQSLDAGESIFEQGEEGEWFYVILEGHVNVILQPNQPSSLLNKTLTKGLFFGELSLLYSIPRSATVQNGNQPSHLAKISKSHFHLVFGQHLEDIFLDSSLAALKKCFFTNQWTKQNIIDFIPHSFLIDVNLQNVLLNEGDVDSDFIFLIIEGEIKLTQENIPLITLGPSFILNDEQLLGCSSPLYTSTCASTQATLLLIRIPIFQQKVLADQKVIPAFMEKVTQKQNLIRQKIEEQSSSFTSPTFKAVDGPQPQPHSEVSFSRDNFGQQVNEGSYFPIPPFFRISDSFKEESSSSMKYASAEQKPEQIQKVKRIQQKEDKRNFAEQDEQLSPFSPIKEKYLESINKNIATQPLEPEHLCVLPAKRSLNSFKKSLNDKLLNLQQLEINNCEVSEKQAKSQSLASKTVQKSQQTCSSPQQEQHSQPIQSLKDVSGYSYSADHFFTNKKMHQADGLEEQTKDSMIQVNDKSQDENLDFKHWLGSGKQLSHSLIKGGSKSLHQTFTKPQQPLLFDETSSITGNECSSQRSQSSLISFSYYNDMPSPVNQTDQFHKQPDKTNKPEDQQKKPQIPVIQQLKAKEKLTLQQKHIFQTLFFFNPKQQQQQQQSLQYGWSQHQFQTMPTTIATEHHDSEAAELVTSPDEQSVGGGKRRKNLMGKSMITSGQGFDYLRASVAKLKNDDKNKHLLIHDIFKKSEASSPPLAVVNKPPNTNSNNNVIAQQFNTQGITDENEIELSPQIPSNTIHNSSSILLDHSSHPLKQLLAQPQQSSLGSSPIPGIQQQNQFSQYSHSLHNPASQGVPRATIAEPQNLDHKTTLQEASANSQLSKKNISISSLLRPRQRQDGSNSCLRTNQMQPTETTNNNSNQLNSLLFQRHLSKTGQSSMNSSKVNLSKNGEQAQIHSATGLITKHILTRKQSFTSFVDRQQPIKERDLTSVKQRGNEDSNKEPLKSTSLINLTQAKNSTNIQGNSTLESPVKVFPKKSCLKQQQSRETNPQQQSQKREKSFENINQALQVYYQKVQQKKKQMQHSHSLDSSFSHGIGLSKSDLTTNTNTQTSSQSKYPKMYDSLLSSLLDTNAAQQQQQPPLLEQLQQNRKNSGVLNIKKIIYSQAKESLLYDQNDSNKRDISSQIPSNSSSSLAKRSYSKRNQQNAQ